MKLSTKRANQKGFTLVELAIVLVIIGLIVGGVLAGQDLIKGAQLQKSIRLIGDTNTAANTFFGKYGQYPGDYTNATQFTTPVAITGVLATDIGMGNGNGLIEATTTGASGSANTASLGTSGETAAFFAELYDAGLFAEPMTAKALSTITAGKAAINKGMFATVGAEAPSSLLAVQGFNSTNYMFIVGQATGAATAGIAQFGFGLSPISAQSIDAKLDDGIASTGNAVATIQAPAATATTATASASTTTAAEVVPGEITRATPSSTNCVSVSAAGAAAQYNIGLKGQLCNLAIKASF